MIDVDRILTTGGDGYWSSKSKSVRITNIDVPYINEENDFGELNVYFDTNTWDTETDGLIYTDKLFLHELKHFLVGQMGLSSDVGYSEQGMQGDDYVSLDVDADFINSWNTKKLANVASDFPINEKLAK